MQLHQMPELCIYDFVHRFSSKIFNTLNYFAKWDEMTNNIPYVSKVTEKYLNFKIQNTRMNNVKTASP